MAVNRTLEEPVILHKKGIKPREVKDKVAEVMQQVGVDPKWAGRYPHRPLRRAAFCMPAVCIPTSAADQNYPGSSDWFPEHRQPVTGSRKNGCSISYQKAMKPPVNADFPRLSLTTQLSSDSCKFWIFALGFFSIHR